MASGSAGRPYAGLSPDARRAQRRRQLLGAALELFGTKGYAASTIAELCREAGVAPAKFYEEFAGKEEVLVELSGELNAEALQAVEAAVEGVLPDLEGVVRRGLAAYCHALLDDPRKARILCLEVVGVSTDVELRRQHYLDRYSELLVAYFAAVSGGVPPGESFRLRIVTMGLVAATAEALVRWLREPGRPEIDELVDTLAGMFLALARWVTDDGAGVDPASSAS